MEELRYDGSRKLTFGVTPQQVAKAVADPRNKKVVVGKPGSVMKNDEGVDCIVQFNGTLRPVRPGELDEPFHRTAEVAKAAPSRRLHLSAQSKPGLFARFLGLFR